LEVKNIENKTVEERIREAAEEGKQRLEKRRERLNKKLAGMAEKRSEEIAKTEQKKREIAEFNALPVDEQHEKLKEKEQRRKFTF